MQHRVVTGCGDDDALVTVPKDVVISVFFPAIIPAGVLDRLTVPALNLHPSLLPAYRGPSPIVGLLRDGAAVQHGGVTLHRMTARIDAGTIYGQIPVRPARTLRHWELDIARAGAELIAERVPAVVRGAAAGREQDETAASYRRIAAEDLLLNACTRAEAQRLIHVLGDAARLRVAVNGRRYAIASAGRAQGPATGAAPSVGWRAIDMDLGNERTRLRRWMPWDGRLRRWQRLLVRVLDRA